MSSHFVVVVVQAVYLLIALGWVFVPVYVASGVSLCMFVTGTQVANIHMLTTVNPFLAKDADAAAAVSFRAKLRIPDPPPPHLPLLEKKHIKTKPKHEVGRS